MYNVCLTIKCDDLEEATRFLNSVKESYHADKNANNSGIQQLPHYETEDGRISIRIGEDFAEEYQEYLKRQIQKRSK